MPIYELTCEQGHRFEVVQSFTASLPVCACGGATRKVPSSFGIGGAAARRLPPSAAMMPQTWKGTHRGDRDYVTSLRRTADQRRDLEARHPELRGDTRPVLAHEGQFEKAPLRAGDAVPKPTSHPHPHPH